MSPTETLSLGDDRGFTVNQKWYALPKEEILKLLNTSAAAGLSPKAARLRYRKHLQSFTEDFLYIAKTSLFSLLSPIFSDVALWILLITLSVMACFRETEKVWICLALLLLHVTLSVCLGKIVSLRKEEISRIASPKICVLRDGNLYRTDFRHVVQGDIVLPEEGDVIPFDLRLLTSDKLTVLVFVGSDAEGNPKYVKREKDAFTDLASSTDLLPEDRTNMITAGSIILSGTARGVVVECGMASSTAIAYGGIRLNREDKPAEERLPSINVLRTIGTALLILTVPMAILPYFVGAEKNFSLIFLSVLSLSATFCTGSILHLLDFSAIIHVFPRKKKAAETDFLIKNLGVSEELAETKILMVLDHTALTSGERRVYSIFLGGTVYRGKDILSHDCRQIAEYLTLLMQKRDASPVEGKVEENLFDRALHHYVSSARVDREMLRIRYVVRDYKKINDPFTIEAIEFTDESGNAGRFLISSDVRSLSRCKWVSTNGRITPFSEQDRFSVVRYVEAEESAGADLLYCMEANVKGEVIFLGAIAALESVLPDVPKTIRRIASAKVQPLFFFRNYTRKNLYYAKASGILSLRREIAFAEQFRKERKPIESDFGRYAVYIGFSVEEIASLVEHLKHRNASISVLSSNKADSSVFGRASTASVICDIDSSGHKHRKDLEMNDFPLFSITEKGTGTEAMKQDADLFVQKYMRKAPHSALSHWMHALRASRVVVEKRLLFFRYVLLSTAFRLGLLLPTLLEIGSPIYPAGFVFASLILDAGVALFIAHRPSDGEIPKYASFPQKALPLLTKEKKALLLSALAGLLLSLLPYLSMLFDPTFIPKLYLILRLSILMIAAIPLLLVTYKR